MTRVLLIALALLMIASAEAINNATKEAATKEEPETKKDTTSEAVPQNKESSSTGKSTGAAKPQNPKTPKPQETYNQIIGKYK